MPPAQIPVNLNQLIAQFPKYQVRVKQRENVRTYMSSVHTYRPQWRGLSGSYVPTLRTAVPPLGIWRNSVIRESS